MRDTWRLAVTVAATILPAVAAGQAMESAVHGNPDSVFAQIRGRLEHLKYREDAIDASNRWMLVERPGEKTKVAIRVEATRDSATVKIDAPDTKDPIATLQAIALVTVDAMLEPEKPGATAAATNGELPPSQWRAEVFVSPLGRLWIARSGLFTTDSLFGHWRLSLDPQHVGTTGQSLSIGTRMAFVDENTMLVGLHASYDSQVHARLYRSTDAGQSWSTVATAQVEGMDALEAVGASVWGFATYFDTEDHRLTAFLRTADGGATWNRASLPVRMRDVTHVYRVSSAVAYLATEGDSANPGVLAHD